MIYLLLFTALCCMSAVAIMEFKGYWLLSSLRVNPQLHNFCLTHVRKILIPGGLLLFSLPFTLLHYRTFKCDQNSVTPQVFVSKYSTAGVQTIDCL